MKKILVVLAALALGVAGVQADTYSYTYANTSLATEVTSAAIPVSGWLDRIEVGHAASTETTGVRVVTVDAAGTVLSSYCAVTANTAVVRTRLIGTGNQGTALAAAYGGVPLTNVTTVLYASYERPMVGGNLVIKTYGNGVTAATNNVTVTIFFEPIKH